MENYVGKRLDGRYEIMEIIGVGGMAVVYKAFDNIDHRIVAVKVLKNEFLENEEFRRRFKNESKAIAVLSHPNIVKVYDVSFGNIIQYIVMEYVEGITLKEYIEQQGKVNPREAIYYITQILKALQHAHDKGIVHRDIKPQNIMLISDGTIKVTDFGIARFSRSETRTMTDGAIGSVHYISPEQAKGSLTDAKTDLYSVGVMLYELLTGRLPFQSDNAVSVALMQLQNDPVKPREINPDIPVGLEQIIIRAMQKNQNDRYQSASEILRDIEEFKRNPNIKFNYSFFADTKASHNISEAENKEAVRVARPAPVNSNVKKVVADDSEKAGERSDETGKKKTIAVLCGVLAALVIFAVILVSFFLPGSNRIDVPDLVGKNFYNDVMYNEAYADFTFDPIIDKQSEEEAGTIIGQTPSSGKIKSGAVITVYISDSRTETPVPDVTGYEYSSAESVLKSYGFEVTILMEVSTTVENNKVIRTSPKAGDSAPSGSTVTIYVSTDEIIENVLVPDLIGLTISQARAKLAESGLYLNSARTEYRGSKEPAGIIIGHEFIGEEVPVGSSIAVFVSTGEVPETTEEEESTEESTESTSESTTESTTQSSQHKHTYEVVKKKDATCTTDGYKKLECTECGDTVKKVIVATGHVKSKAVAENKTGATCTQGGSYERVVYCSVCNFEISRETVTVTATGHNIVQDAAKAPTCSEPGLTAGSHCSECGEIIIPQETVASTGHVIVTDSAVAATCEKSGLSEGAHCSVCGTIITAPQVISPTGHSDSNSDGSCDSCGQVIAAPPSSGEPTSAISNEEDNEDEAE